MFHVGEVPSPESQVPSRKPPDMTWDLGLGTPGFAPWWREPCPLLLAPLADFTDAPQRRMAALFGVGWTTTEMVNARALAGRQGASLGMLVSLPDGGERVPCSAQLYGDRPEDFGNAAAVVEGLGLYSAIDINCGCPMPRIRATGAGAVLMEKPDVVRRIVEAVRSHCSLPVTVKIRLGPSPDRPTAADILRAAADGGASAAVVHARYTSQIHSGALDTAELARVNALGILPLAANGGIRSGADALRLKQECGVETVMIGWGGIGNPWLVRAAAESLRRGEPVERIAPSPEELRATLEGHFRLQRIYRERQRALYPGVQDGISLEEGLVLDFRTRFFRYLKGLPGSNRFRAGLSSYKTLAEIKNALDALFVLKPVAATSEKG